MSRPGDWNCRSCQHLNFSWRDSCQRCGDTRTGERGDYGGFGGRGGSDVRPGDWYCSAANCGAHNFASRSSCFKCGAFKDESASGYEGDMSRPRGFGFGTGGRSAWRSGDWFCSRFHCGFCGGTIILCLTCLLLENLRADCNEHNFASRMECFRCNTPRDFGNR